MIHVARGMSDVRATERELQLDKLSTFRNRGRMASLEAYDELSEAYGHKILPLFARRGPGAASLVVTLADLGVNGQITKNTYTGPATNLSSEVNGSFPLDYFSKKGATFEAEGMGILSVVAATTPTIVFRFTFGTAIGAITTLLANHPAITTISGLANADWYIKLHGIVVTFGGTASTILVSGYMLAQLATAAAGNNLTFLKNATPPSAVAVDLVTAGIFFDLQTTWSASAAGNQIITNLYQLQSEAA